MNEDTDHSSSSVSTGSYYDHGYHKIEYFADSAVPINLSKSLPGSNWCPTRQGAFSSSSSSSSSNQKIPDDTTDVSTTLRQILLSKKNGRSRNGASYSYMHSRSSSGDSDFPIADKNYKGKHTDIGVGNKIMKKKAPFKSKGSSSGSYGCKICHQVFSDFHSLGGHIASHNRKKRAEEAALAAPGPELKVQALEKLATTEGINGDTDNYICELCSKSFPTGQALGGHKTSHRKRKAAPQECTDHQVASSAENHVYEFDLNESPNESFWGRTGTGLVY
ncbi:hypothetical protein RCOM_0302120 [Ricinus communis]|uniref:C2H2-type domain-containing protein n=1 Tax=Ricinus communis TaxID=3988 RepID=B9T0J6_RICCO|nr:hypothetical protein RCOM_0302120 [Ricinus communis]|eukprot:XP_002531765.1 zinc finger protein AZF2 [Ricinus communis]